jgi:hypothetical protein
VIQSRNYCTQAIEQFVAYEFGYTAPMHHELDAQITLQTRETAVLLREAEKFLMPEWGRIFDKDDFGVLEDMAVPNRLPYPIIACEYFCDYSKHDTMIPGEMASSKRIALLVEKEMLKARAPHTWQWTIKTKPEDDAVIADEGFFVIPVCFFDAGNIWSPAPCMGFMNRNERPQEFRARIVITALGIGSYIDYPDDEKRLRAQRDIADESICAIHLLMALAMERTSMTTLPAPTQLNKKRERKGKPPLFEYKVLDIVADIMETPKAGVGRPHGNHASPRMHKRRGHIRRLDNNRTTWVRNTIVGKPGKGEVRKDYNVHS